MEEEPSTAQEASECRSTPKRRIFVQPRYVSEVRTPHLNSPRSAKRCFNMARTKLDFQTAKIKKLQRKNRTLSKRVANLQQLLGHLKKKNLLSENSVESLLVSIFFYCSLLKIFINTPFI